MRIGLVARADGGGLGTISEGFTRNMAPERILIADRQPRRGPWRPERFGGYGEVRVEPVGRLGLSAAAIRSFCEGLDVVYGIESWYGPFFERIAAEAGVKTILHAMPEFYAAQLPDALWVPTPWQIGWVPGAEVVPVPVDRARLTPRIRTEARTFLHIASKAGRDRNGTRVMAEALRFVGEACRLIVVAERGVQIRAPRHVQLEVRSPHGEWPDIYDEADVLIMTRRYGGLCLPILEATCAGMPAIVSDRLPDKAFTRLRVPLSGEQTRPFVTWSGQRIPVASPEPRSLAQRIDEMVRDPARVAEASVVAVALGELHSWDLWRSDYLRRMEALCSTPTVRSSPTPTT